MNGERAITSFSRTSKFHVYNQPNLMKNAQHVLDVFPWNKVKNTLFPSLYFYFYYSCNFHGSIQSAMKWRRQLMFNIYCSDNLMFLGAPVHYCDILLFHAAKRSIYTPTKLVETVESVPRHGGMGQDMCHTTTISSVTDFSIQNACVWWLVSFLPCFCIKNTGRAEFETWWAVPTQACESWPLRTNWAVFWGGP